MRRRIAHRVAAGVALALLAASLLAAPGMAFNPEEGPFERTWQRTDLPVASGAASRTWMWGPEAITEGFFEPYAEAHNNGRFVQYFDKSRMEINHHPQVDPDSPWYVTNGLLAKELITGEMQVGDESFEDRVPSDMNVAGDLDDPDGPTYATFSILLDEEPHPAGSTIISRVDPAGVVTQDEELSVYGATAAQRVTVPGIDHQVASPFWEFMNSSGVVHEDGQNITDLLFENPYYATGYPITEAYWTTVRVGGTPKDVLMQCFERRCLTYTPDNPDGWKVEAGNVGLHYYHWRHEQETPQAPSAGAELRAWNVDDWWEDEEPELYAVSKVGDELHLSVLAGFEELYAFIDPDAFPGEVPQTVVSFDVRSLTPGVVGFGCAALRHWTNGASYGVYLYCIDDLGALTLWYESWDDNAQEGVSDLLMSFRSSMALNPIDEWNTLSAVLDGSQFWLYANGDLVGYVEDDRFSQGKFALYALNFDENEPANALTYAFTNVSIWTID